MGGWHWAHCPARPLCGQVWPDDSRQLLLHRSPGNRPRHSGERQGPAWHQGWQVDVLGVDSELPPLSPQLTVLNAGRRYLGVEDLAGKVFVTSGLGGMSGAQAKASVIVGCIGVIAEVSTPGMPSPRPCPPRSFLIPESLTPTPVASLAPSTKPPRWVPGQHILLPSKSPSFLVVMPVGAVP